MKKPILVCSSDWHLRTTVPTSRAERSWFDVMENRINQIKASFDGVPLVVSGDFFDRPDPPSSLVSWALANLKGMEIYTIPGQHDLACHQYSARNDGAYGALIKAGVIQDLPALRWTTIGSMRAAVSMYAMPWGMYELPQEPAPHGTFRLCVLHKYVYSDHTNAYIGVEETASAVGLTAYFDHFDLISIGDNHIPWRLSKIVNHGSLFSMTSAQIGHIPYIGIVYDDHSFEIQRFPEEDVQWQATAVEEKKREVVAQLHTMEVITADFKQSIAVQAEQAEGAVQIVYNDLLTHLS